METLQTTKKEPTSTWTPAWKRIADTARLRQAEASQRPRSIHMVTSQPGVVLPKLLALLDKHGINYDSVLVGPCETPGAKRILVSSFDPMITRIASLAHHLPELLGLEVSQAEPVEFALVRNRWGRLQLAGSTVNALDRLGKEPGTAFIRVQGVL